jgi:hypothetical protein
MKHCLYGSQHYVHLYKAAGDAESVMLQKLSVNLLLVIKPHLCLLQLLKLLWIKGLVWQMIEVLPTQNLGTAVS